MTNSPIAVHHADVPTSRLRTHVLTAGPGDAPVLVLVHGNVSSGRFFAPAMSVLPSGTAAWLPTFAGSGCPRPPPWTRGAASGISPTTCTRC